MEKYITDINQLDLSKTYTYADYLMWRFKERVELIKGKVLQMSPAPARTHQKISREISGHFYNFFKNRDCQFFSAPFDVRLLKKEKTTPENEIYTVVQPDLCVICDNEKLDDRGCLGAPDLVVEILSPGNSQKEMGEKFRIYEESGVLEYWIVEPQTQTILVYVQQNGRFIGLQPYTCDTVVKSTIFTELSIQVQEIFND